MKRKALWFHQLAYIPAFNPCFEQAGTTWSKELCLQKFEAFLKWARRRGASGVEVVWILFNDFFTPEDIAPLLKKYKMGIAFTHFNPEKDPINNLADATWTIDRLFEAGTFLKALRGLGIEDARCITGPWAKQIGKAYDRSGAFWDKLVAFGVQVVEKVATPLQCIVCEEPLRGTERSLEVAALEDGAITTVEIGIKFVEDVRSKTGDSPWIALHIDLYHMITNGENVIEWIKKAIDAGVVGWFHAGGDEGRAAMTEDVEVFKWTDLWAVLEDFNGPVCVELFCALVREKIDGLGDGLKPSDPNENEVTALTLHRTGGVEFAAA